ncbi:Pachytene checkpoint protein 2 like [Schistosoma japonicum]|nr:Pachytene checkpoint protein 2 like [Schistosoma japonicum]
MISLLNDFLTKTNEKDITCVKSLIRYPLERDRLSFSITKEDEKLLYDKYFIRIMCHTYETMKESPTTEMLSLAKFLTEFSKSDIWLECACSLLSRNNIIPKDQLLIVELERFFSELNKVPDFINACINSEEVSSDGSSVFLESRARLLSNVPHYVANVIHENSYFTNVRHFVERILSTFDFNLHVSEVTYQLLGLIVSHLCLAGYSKYVTDFIVGHIQHDSTNFWSKLLVHLNTKSMEMCLSPLAKECPTPEMYHTLSSSFLETSSLTFDAYLRLCRRLFYIRQFKTGNTIRNIFSSFCMAVLKCQSPKKSADLAMKVDEVLGLPALRLWSDLNSLQTASLERRIYLSQILISWFVDFRNPVRADSSINLSHDHLLPDVLNGISIHLGSPRVEIRTLGMVIGEWIVNFFNWIPGDENQELKFEYEELSFLKQIRPYFIPLNKTPNVESTDRNNALTRISQSNETSKIACCSPDTEAKSEHCGVAKHTIDELDSDDDPNSDSSSMIPLPSVSTPNNDNKAPFYLRECLDGMLLSKVEDNRVNIACTLSAEKLIYAHPEAAQELALEFARVLVHIEPPVTPDPEQIARARHRALIAIGVVAPKKCARYLTSEFCQSGYSIGQRMNIISSLTDIALFRFCYLMEKELANVLLLNNSLKTPTIVEMKEDKIENHLNNNKENIYDSKIQFSFNLSSSSICEHQNLTSDSSLRPIHAEVSISPYNCEEFATIESYVVDFLRRLGPRHIPTVLNTFDNELNLIVCDGEIKKLHQILTNCVVSINLMLDEADGIHDNDAGRSVNLCIAPILVHIYQLVNGDEALPVQELIEFGSESINGGTTWLLPSAEMLGLWESLIFDTDIKLNLLQYAQTALLFADREVSSSVISWNRVILLYGPPGTGKTSLCRALANKLAIRMADRYSSTQLIEINTMNLMSKWFSESARLVTKMFDSIKEYLESHDHLVCLLVDEVESLTAIRTSSMSGCEPSDAIRVVNSVLTQIDQIKRYPNVLIMATSNVTGVIDPAFLDRADVRIFIGPPSPPAIYSIYRTCLYELIRVGLITSTEDSRLLSYQTLASVQFTENQANSLSMELWRLAEHSHGLNGRTLRKLPLLAYAFHLNKVIPDMRYNSVIHYRRIHLPPSESNINSKNNINSSILNETSSSLGNIATSSMCMNESIHSSTIAPAVATVELSSPLLTPIYNCVKSNNDKNVSLDAFIKALRLTVDAQFIELKSLDLATSMKGRLIGSQ